MQTQTKFRIHHKLYRFKIQNYFFTHTELILFLVFLFFNCLKEFIYYLTNRLIYLIQVENIEKLLI
jgi:hypothetical protein